MERLDRFVFAHRRLLAAVAAGLAVLLALGSVRSDDPGTPVVVAAHDLDSGTPLTTQDLKVVHLPAGVVPDSATTDPDVLAGQRIAGPVRAGEVLTDRRVLDPGGPGGGLDGWGIEGASLASVRLADAGVLSLLQVGYRVDVVAVDPHGGEPPRVLARDAVVATVPSLDEWSTAGQVVGVITDNAAAIDIASAGLAMSLTLVTH